MALDEIRRGAKQSHGMWFIFPQIVGLGTSPMTQRYAIESLDEAKAYLDHPLLGQRCRECLSAPQELPVRDAEEVFGLVDAWKLRSSLTLFALASREGLVEACSTNGFQVQIRKPCAGLTHIALHKDLFHDQCQLIGGSELQHQTASRLQLVGLGHPRAREEMMTMIENDLSLPAPERIQALLFDAARLGREDVIPALLQAGADIGATNAKGHTALILAAYHDHGGAVALLLDHGALIDQGDTERGNTALMGVAFKGFAGVARQLLAAGADPHVTNKAGQTALMMAALFGHGEIVDALLMRGADPHQHDAAGNSALSVATSQANKTMRARLEAGAST